MRNKDTIQKTGFGIAIGALIALMTSFVVWLMRSSRPPAPQAGKQAAPQAPKSVSAYAGGPSQPGRLPSGETGASAYASTEYSVSTPSDLAAAPEPGSSVTSGSVRWTPTTRYLVAVGMVIFIVWLFWFSRASLSMIVIAALLAFILRPSVLGMQKRYKMSKGKAVLLIYLIVILVMILVPILVIPLIANSVNDLMNTDWSASAQNFVARLDATEAAVENIPVLGPILANFLQAIEDLILDLSVSPAPAPVELSSASAAATLSQMLGKLASILGPVIGAIVSLVFMLLISLQMSLAADGMQAAYPRLFPERFRPEFIALAERLSRIWTSFLRGQLTLMVVIGVMVSLLNWLIGTPYPFALGLIAGFLEVIPSLGPLLALIPAFIVALMFGSTRFVNMDPLLFAIIVAIGYGLIQALENQVLVPYILGDAVDIPPVAVLIGVTVAGSTIGLLGIFLATPIISTGKEIMGYLYEKILEAPEAPPPPEEKVSLVDQARSLLGRIPNPFRRGKKPAQVEAAAQAIEVEAAEEANLEIK